MVVDFANLRLNLLLGGGIEKEYCRTGNRSQPFDPRRRRPWKTSRRIRIEIERPSERKEDSRANSGRAKEAERGGD